MSEDEHHVCPWWIGYILTNPLRKLVHNPRKILGDYIKPGMRVLDLGCAMGFFSLPMAERVGGSGQVICVDVQQKMLDRLVERARRCHLDQMIQPRLCTADSLGVDDLAGQMDFVLAFAMAHEVPSQARLFADIRKVLKPDALALVAEPKGRVTDNAFSKTVAAAEAASLAVIESPRIPGCHAVLMNSQPQRPNPV